MIAPAAPERPTVLGQPGPELGIGAGFQGMGSDTHDAGTIARAAALLPRLEEEIHAALRAVAAGAFRKSSGSALPAFQCFQAFIEAPDIFLPRTHFYLPREKVRHERSEWSTIIMSISLCPLI